MQTNKNIQRRSAHPRPRGVSAADGFRYGVEATRDRFHRFTVLSFVCGVHETPTHFEYLYWQVRVQVLVFLSFFELVYQSSCGTVCRFYPILVRNHSFSWKRFQDYRAVPSMSYQTNKIHSLYSSSDVVSLTSTMDYSVCPIIVLFDRASWIVQRSLWC